MGNSLFTISPVVLDLSPPKIIRVSFWVTTVAWYDLSWLKEMVNNNEELKYRNLKLANSIHPAWPMRQEMHDFLVKKPPHATRSPLLMTDREW